MLIWLHMQQNRPMYFLRRAFAIARTPPCGPVFLSLPMDVLAAEADEPAPPRSAAGTPRAWRRT